MEEEKVAIPIETVKVLRKKRFSRCKSPLCLDLIWRDGFLYGNGEYCDQFCQSEARRYERIKRENFRKDFPDQAIIPRRLIHRSGFTIGKNGIKLILD